MCPTTLPAMSVGTVRTSFAVACLMMLACSGNHGGADRDGRRSAGSCREAGGFCLTSCNLGCVQNGCELREIAQNQRLRFHFNQDVDPRTVDFTTISLKTRFGAEPVGTFVVESSVVTFVPEVRAVGSATFFGFSPNETYLLALPGRGDEPNLRSTAGDPLTESFVCTLEVTGGVVDLDQAPPHATLVAPASRTAIPGDATLVLQFSEIVDRLPFDADPGGVSAPVQVFALLQNPDRSCDFGSERQAIAGSVRLESDSVRNVTTWTFLPGGMLPSRRCLEVRVTPRVRDIAGVAATPQSFFLSTGSTGPAQQIAEEFDDASQFDRARSGGTWTDGIATFLPVGGDGRHGDFDFRTGVFDPVVDEWVFDTSTVVAADENGFDSSGAPGGEYHFTRFIVPVGETVRFRGADSVRIHVRGECAIRGKLSFDGSSPEQFFDVSSMTLDAAGQRGASGGPGGGAGGSGGQQCDGLGATPDNDGRDGATVQVAAGHAFASNTPGTGGRGSRIFPVSGESADILRTILTFSGQGANGGSGGGFATVGGDGRVVQTASGLIIVPTTRPAADSQGGAAFSLLPLPIGESSLEHFSVGGSGGGGGGSHPFFQPRFIAGSAGAGGGGAAALRVGRLLRIAPGGVLQSRGGDAAEIISPSGFLPTIPLPSPGGGGAGGSLLLQFGGDVVRDVSLLGRLDVRGGRGGNVEIDSLNSSGHIIGGAGAAGVIRLEARDSISLAGLTVLPATGGTKGMLQDSDTMAGIMSRFYDTGGAAAPQFLRYEIAARIDGVPVMFSDDPAVGVEALPGQPLQFLVQAADLDPLTGLPRPDRLVDQWLRRVAASPVPGVLALADVDRTAFRWQLLADRSVAGPAGSIVVESVRLLFVF